MELCWRRCTINRVLCPGTEFAYGHSESLLEDVEQPVLRAKTALLGDCVKLDLGILHEALCVFEPCLENQVLRSGAPELAEAEREKLRRP